MARHDRQESRGCRHKAGWQAGIGGLDREEFFVLTVARYFFQSFADPQTEGWTRAMLGAESWLGRDAAPELVHAVFHVIQKMRCARRSTFQFSNPDCPHCAATLCAHERLLLNACRSMARGRPEEAAGHAMILCEGNDTGPLLEEMLRLARGMPLCGVPAQSRIQ